MFLNINLVGNVDPDARSFVMQSIRVHGFRANVTHSSKDTSLCETPTILLLDKHCKACERKPVLYLHSKGVAHPNSTYRTYWRWHMQCYLIRQLDVALMHLNNHSWVAASPRNGNWPSPHAAGNYFLTWSTFIKSLPPFTYYRDKMFWNLPNMPSGFRIRHADEMWLGIAGHHGYPMAPETHEPWDPKWWRSSPEIIRLVTKHH